MSGPKRNPDKLNTIGIVVVGICGAVLVYVTIVALQAFYMNDTSDLQNTADYGGQDTGVKALRAEQMRNITDFGMNQTGTYHMPIDQAMQLVVRAAQGSDALYVPVGGSAICGTSLPIPGRGHPNLVPGTIADCPGAKTMPPATGSGAGSAAGSGAGSATVEPAGSGAGSAAGSGAGSATGSAGGHAR